MINYNITGNNLKRLDKQITSVVIIEGKNKIVYSSEDGDIREDVRKVIQCWESKRPESLLISGKKYSILNCTYNVFIAYSVLEEEYIVGVKEFKKKIICKVSFRGKEKEILFDFPGELEAGISGIRKVKNVLTQIVNVLLTLSPKREEEEISLEEEFELGKLDEIERHSLKILSDTTRILQKLGLQQFGLSIHEAKVYLALLQKGKKGDKVGNLDRRLDIKRTTIYPIVERLIEDGWVVKAIKTPGEPQKYVARPLNELLDKYIEEKEEEIKILKSFRFLMGESLKDGHVSISEANKSIKFETLGMTGVEKDCGLIIFEFEEQDIIKEDKDLIQSTLNFFNKKMEYEIRIQKISDLEDLKFEDKKIKGYFGVILYVRFKEGSSASKIAGTDWIVAAKIVAIPVATKKKKSKVFVIWGEESKFQVLMDIVLKLH